MKQEQFTRKYQADWQQLETMLGAIDEAGSRPSRVDDDVSDLPRLYRNSCHQLALARGRAYSPRLIGQLSELVARGHQALYRNRPGLWSAVIEFIAAGFPQLVRQQWRVVLAAGLLFFGPLLMMLAVIQVFPQAVYTVLPPSQAASMERMYEPNENGRIGESRDSDSDIAMFGFYLRNNTGIGFRTFAGGLLFGLGTVIFLGYNGLVIGATAGHLTHVGHIETFWGFVAGHSAPELTAIVLSGAAGLKLGWALIAPRRRTRLRALRDASRDAVRLVYGAALLFLLAAFIEAFWSSMASIPVMTKYIAGVVLWLLLWGYLLAAGRRHAV